MKRLIKDLGTNSPELYDQIFFDRVLKGVDERDLKRWKKLIKYYRGGRFIDMGCLDSLAPVLVKEQYPKEEVWGIDTAQGAIEEMSQRFPFVYYKVIDLYETHFPDNYFSYAVAGEVIEHLDDPEKFITEALRILKHGGTLALSTPLEETGIGEVDLDNHVWSYTIQDMYTLLGKYGKVTTKIMGSEYFPKYRYFFPTLLAYVRKD